VHPFGDLSAYLDGALSPETRASVQAHLDACALCRRRLAELRGTARLIAALPAPVPSRSLVPRVSVPVWLAPLRTFSTFASGAALFLFLASAVVSSFPRARHEGRRHGRDLLAERESLGPGKASCSSCCDRIAGRRLQRCHTVSRPGPGRTHGDGGPGGENTSRCGVGRPLVRRGTRGALGARWRSGSLQSISVGLARTRGDVRGALVLPRPEAPLDLTAILVM